jgi:cell division protein FtsZ
MTGHAAESAPQAARQQPTVQAVQSEPEYDEDQERIEIPAFLRRQAN